MLVRRTNIMKQLTITHPQVTLESLRAELRKTQLRRKTLRILGLIKILEGKKTNDISDFLGVFRTSITDWVKRINDQGWSGLEEKPGRGLKSRLNKSQKLELKKDLLKSPKEFGFPSNLWTGKILKEHIKRCFGIKYQLAKMYVLFKELGFTLQRPTKKLLGVKPVQQKEFKLKLKKNHQRNH